MKPPGSFYPVETRPRLGPAPPDHGLLPPPLRPGGGSRAARAAAADLTDPDRSALTGENLFLKSLVHYTVRLAWEMQQPGNPPRHPVWLPHPVRRGSSGGEHDPHVERAHAPAAPRWSISPARSRNWCGTAGWREGVCHIFEAHTTAGLTINENADPSVQSDILMVLNKIISEKEAYRHLEGNSPAHLKASLMGPQLTVLVSHGRLLLGTWQGIFLCEFDGPRTRKVHLKIMAG